MMKFTEAEWQLMNALWQGHPATARQIAGRLPAGVTWAYTTIKTMLTRLVNKGALAERKEGNTSVYEPLVSQRAARRRALRGLMDQAFDGALGPLVHFLVDEQELPANERQELLETLKDSEGKDQKGQS